MSGAQPSLLSVPPPSQPAGIDLRCCGVDVVLAEVRGAALVHADPPWVYARVEGVANPSDPRGVSYAVLTEADIVDHLSASYACAASGSRLVCWYTWPKDAEWTAAGGAGRWGARVTGGAWVKTGSRLGVGYHWRGHSEPLAVFTKGSTGRARTTLRNEWRSDPTSHSEKPVGFLRAMLRAWTDPGDLVLDLYAGLGPMARACAAEGRRYIGAEIDPDRHRQAVDMLAQRRFWGDQ